ncbi:uncharacterized protein Triagg1_1378 [Trichoderma aggressivum f. europaeum]|uniref:Uncharacterized protein n=1 Tax=Trichoderma aggressivum f. europaeum TaxID=173218 RepID=A0AAE1IKN4_9HYPO|nr:hypothetical protein Triagg1_1378 [Trichoderma aggressivum f. europaeum]
MDRHIVNLVEKVDRAWVDYSVAKCAYTTYKMSIFYRERNPEIQEWGDKQYHSAVEGLLQQKELLQLLQQRAPIKLPEAVSRVVQFDFLSPDLDRQHREIKDLRAALAAKNGHTSSVLSPISVDAYIPSIEGRSLWGEETSALSDIVAVERRGTLHGEDTAPYERENKKIGTIVAGPDKD